MMVKMITALLQVMLLWSLPVYALEHIQLTPDKGVLQFPYFKKPTPVWNYNGQVPGPVIRATEGSTIAIDVVNRLEEPTSIHWHGLRIDNTMDGVPGVTQEPIKPGDSFTYRLKLNEAGTFWYHPHLNAGEQLERGLKGVLIVEESERQPWSQDLIMLIDDWRLQKSGKIYPRFNTPHDLMHDGRWGNVATVNGVVKPEYVVSPGERIRLRLINGANARVFSPIISDLKAHIIAVDGRPVTTVIPLKQFFLAPGNRIDLDLVIPPDAGGYAYKLKDGFTNRTLTLATIQVRNTKKITTPDFKPPTAENFIPAEIFQNIRVSKTWDLNAIRGGKYGIGWSMNQRLWPDPDTVNFALGKPQKILFVNTSNRLHPMHIHGVFFRVLGKNGKSFIEPFTRDTVMIGPREKVLVGLIPEHDGIWLTHCHIQSHADAGMMTTITVE